jgi:hypothetical protein
MARLKLKQVLSNLSYVSASNQLILSGSTEPSFVVSGSVVITSTPTITGSLTIKDIDSFGDSGSFFTVDLGEY